MHKLLDILNIVVSMALLYGQRKYYRKVLSKTKDEANKAIASWHLELLRQLEFNADLRRQKNAAIFREGHARGQVHRLTGRVTRAERFLSQVNINNFTRRPPPMPSTGACAAFLRNHHQLEKPHGEDLQAQQERAEETGNVQ